VANRCHEILAPSKDHGVRVTLDSFNQGLLVSRQSPTAFCAQIYQLFAQAVSVAGKASRPYSAGICFMAVRKSHPSRVPAPSSGRRRDSSRAFKSSTGGGRQKNCRPAMVEAKINWPRLRISILYFFVIGELRCVSAALARMRKLPAFDYRLCFLCLAAKFEASNQNAANRNYSLREIHSEMRSDEASFQISLIELSRADAISVSARNPARPARCTTGIDRFDARRRDFFSASGR